VDTGFFLCAFGFLSSMFTLLRWREISCWLSTRMSRADLDWTLKLQNITFSQVHFNYITEIITMESVVQSGSSYCFRF
jgi:hypothetical protein